MSFSLRESDILHILSFLDIESIKLLQATCHALEVYGRLVANNRYDAILLRYVSSPEFFRMLLDAKRAAIGGSCAVEFLLGEVDWYPSDLDVFIRPAYLDFFLRLFHDEGYKRVSPWEEDVLPARQIPCVEASVKLVKRNRTVDLIVTSLGNAFEGIVHSWTTILMNALSGSNVISAYPLWTMNLKGVVSSTKTIALRHLPCADDQRKYEDRHFTFILPETQRSSIKPPIPRYIPDKYCLFLPLRPPHRRHDNRPFNLRYHTDPDHVAMSVIWYDN